MWDDGEEAYTSTKVMVVLDEGRGSGSIRNKVQKVWTRGEAAYMELGIVYSFPDPKVNVISGAEPLSVQAIAPLPACAPIEAQILSTEAGSSLMVSERVSLNSIF